MSSKSKKKEPLIEHDFVFDSVQEAEQTAKKQSIKLKFTLIMTIITGAITLIDLILFIMSKSDEMLGETAYGLGVIGVILMLICLNKDAFKYAIKLIKFAWYIIPIFPIDLFVAISVPVAVLSLAVFAPVIPCFIPLYQAKIELDEAKKYLSLCKSNSRSNQNNAESSKTTQTDYSDISNESRYAKPTFQPNIAFDSPVPVEIDFSLFE